MTAVDTAEKAENTNTSGNSPRSNEEGETVTDPGVDGELEPPSTPTDINIVHRCVLRNDTERFIKCFEDEEDPFKDTVVEQINERDEEGKSPVDMAAILGRIDMMKEMLTRGAEVNNATGKGYTALHHAAAWGKANCLKALVEGGGDLQLKTSHEERPREIAVRYNQAECVDFLDWAEAKQVMIQTITGLQEIMSDPEKIQGKIDRTEKNSTLTLIKDKLEWVESVTDVTTQDFINQKLEFEETVAPVLQKINEPPPEKPEKK